jgi:hypothetical protein
MLKILEKFHPRLDEQGLFLRSEKIPEILPNHETVQRTSLIKNLDNNETRNVSQILSSPPDQNWLDKFNFYKTVIDPSHPGYKSDLATIVGNLKIDGVEIGKPAAVEAADIAKWPDGEKLTKMFDWSEFDDYLTENEYLRKRLDLLADDIKTGRITKIVGKAIKYTFVAGLIAGAVFGTEQLIGAYQNELSGCFYTAKYSETNQIGCKIRNCFASSGGKFASAEPTSNCLDLHLGTIASSNRAILFQPTCDPDWTGTDTKRCSHCLCKDAAEKAAHAAECAGLEPEEFLECKKASMLDVLNELSNFISDDIGNFFSARVKPWIVLGALLFLSIFAIYLFLTRL